MTEQLTPGDQPVQQELDRVATAAETVPLEQELAPARSASPVASSAPASVPGSGPVPASLSGAVGSRPDALFGGVPRPAQPPTPTARRSTTVEFTTPPAETSPSARTTGNREGESPDAESVCEPPAVLGFLVNIETSETIPLCADVNTIGRGSANTIVLDIPNVSRVHCQLEYSHRGFRLTDFASTNGTFVNQSRIESCDLHPGDLIRLGAMVFRFESG